MAAARAAAAVFTVLYYKLLNLHREALDEMREHRVSADRPQVLVEADYDRLPKVDLVLKNVGRWGGQGDLPRVLAPRGELRRPRPLRVALLPARHGLSRKPGA